MRIKKKSYIFLAASALFFIWCFVGRHGIFASNGDWSSQHSVIPDYFRQQFYETGQLFPEFSASLGGGQNIYHFSYYGLLSPLILPSYLLPFVKMSDYVMAVSILCLIASAMLLHIWLKRHGFCAEIRLAASMLFLLAAPMVYQFHRQIMFVNYMPFLCMAFIGVDRYWEKGKSGLYAAGVFFMVMTSFYFSVAGILALLLYGVSRYRKTAFRWPMLRFFLPMGIAVCASGILLLPTACALFARSGNATEYAFESLLVPDFSETRFAYSGYGIGLTVGILTVLFLVLFGKDKRDRLLSLGCLVILTVPFFSWLLNGGLYARGKSLIPFLPVLCYLAARCLKGVWEGEVSFWKSLLSYAGTVLWCAVSFFAWGNGELTREYALVFAELSLMPPSFLLYRKTRLLPILAAPSLCCLIVFGFCLNDKGKDWMDPDFYESVTDEAWGEEISSALDQESGLFRLEQRGSHEESKSNINRIWDTRQWITSCYSSAYQEGYRTFREKAFQTEQPYRNCLMQSASKNPLFRKLMGVKYLAEKEEGVTVRAQEHTAPVIYATDRVMPAQFYQKLSFPDSQTALMRYAAVEGGAEADLQEGRLRQNVSAAEEATASFVECGGLEQAKDGYRIRSKKDVHTSLALQNEKGQPKGQLWYLQFDVRNQKAGKDVIIEIEGIRNNLSADSHIYYNGNTTFTYVMAPGERQEEAAVTFGAGEYDISNIRAFMGDASLLEEDALYQASFLPDQKQTKGNRICGEITVEKKGYLITSIPYDEGFTLWIDGEEVQKELVNTAFLGAKIGEGRHRVEIRYHAPGRTAGMLVSGIGALAWAALMLWERRRPHLTVREGT